MKNTGARTFIILLWPVASIFLLFLTGEIALRAYLALRYDVPFIDRGRSPNRLDERLGWRATENYLFEGEQKDISGTRYPVKVSQDNNGFRMFGDLSSDRPRIFVIGDSATQAVHASDSNTYFAIIRDLLSVDVYAYGGGGFGSLQEFLVFDEHLDLIGPDLVLWQYSTNDFVNNSPEFEMASTANNNGMTRPYLVDGNIQYLLPFRDLPSLRLFSLAYCRSCHAMLTSIDKLRTGSGRQHVETQTALGEAASSLFIESVQTTDKIMERVRTRAGSIPIAAFVVGSGDFDFYGHEYEEALATISRAHDIVLLNGIDAAVRSAEARGAVVRAPDGSHWNETGHRIAGDAIVSSLSEAFSEGQIVLD